MHSEPVDLAGVTRRERDVLELLGDHLTHEEIGRRLFISVRTVESHVASLRRKLNTPGHRALVRLAAAQRLVTDAPLAAPPPVPLTSFVGRQAELAELAGTLREARVVSAVGPGGVGKTRLVLEVARILASGASGRGSGLSYPGGARWVDVAPVTESAQLEEAVAEACGAIVSSRRGPVEALIALLRDQQALLVLDNCEHLINAAAVLVEQLATGCPELTILITSRIRLALSFEHVFRVSGLSPDPHGDAVTLFIERAVAAGSPVPSEAERDRISAICAALGGLALAVELAAVRMPSLGLDGVEHGLLRQQQLLTGGSRLTPRHRSMHETLDWSAALLDVTSATLLRRIGVLITPFDDATAAAVAAFAPLSADDVRPALAQLSEHHLLITSTVGGGLTHRMLEPVRQYALGQMTAADRRALGRHLAWCRRSAEALLSEPDAGVAGRQQVSPGLAIADDMRAALARAAADGQPHATAAGLARAFGLLLFRNGSLREAETRMEQAAELTADGVQAAADLARGAAVAKCRVAGEDALRLEVTAAERARAAGATTVTALALARSAELVNRFSGMFASQDERSADSFIGEARRLAPRDPHVAAAIIVALAFATDDTGNQTFQSAQAAVEAARAVRDPLLESSALDAASNNQFFRGEVVQAYRLAGERIARMGSWRDEPAAALELKDALHMATLWALGAGDLIGARELAQRQHELPFLRERRDLADDELLAAAALAGDWAAVLDTAPRFLEDWTAAGRPAASGRALAPASVALAHGLRGDHAARSEWLGVLAEMRGVPRAEASRGTGYGELFEAMVLLHEERPAAALDAVTADGQSGMYVFAFRPWLAAIEAEAAVLAGHADASSRLKRAEVCIAGNPVATGITRRAAAVWSGDRARLGSVADEFDRAGALYQGQRTRALAALEG